MPVAERIESRQAVKNGRKCRVCDHPQLSRINALLADCTVSKRGIALQFDIPAMSVQRHSVSHLPAKVAKAIERKQNREGDSFLDGIERNIRRMGKGVAHGIAALETGQIEPELAFRMAPAFAAQQLRGLELLGKATGRLEQDQAQRPTSVIVLQSGPVTMQIGQSAAELEDDENTLDIKAIGS